MTLITYLLNLRPILFLEFCTIWLSKPVRWKRGQQETKVNYSFFPFLYLLSLSPGSSQQDCILLVAPDCTQIQDTVLLFPVDHETQEIFRCLTSADCRLQTADCRLRTTDYGLRTADCRLRTADCGLQTADCRLQTADCRLQITDCNSGPQTVDYTEEYRDDWGSLAANLEVRPGQSLIRHKSLSHCIEIKTL